jgi:sn-glycerol 3-phosphate transport system ATP-binding protein
MSAPANPSSIEFRQLYKRYGTGPWALEAVDLTIDEGSFCVLVGPSGCGKSTLLRLIAGLEDPTSGSVHLMGRDMLGVDPSARDVAMVFQNYALYPHMTVEQNLSYGVRNRGVAPAQVEQRVREVAQTLQLEGLLARRPRELSGGQRQRVAMGRAMVREPVCYLFDEPLSNLDAQLRVDLRYEIRQLHQRLGRTTVYVTHDQAEAMTLADLLVVMNRGRIEQMGAPLELYQRPATRFVAGFIGSPSMNLVPAVQEAAGVAFDGLLLPGAAVAQPGTPVWLGIRPEHLSTQPPPYGVSLPLDLSVRLVEEMGHYRVIHGQHADRRWTLTLPLSTEPIAPQLRVWVSMAACHWFDRATDARLPDPEPAYV